METERQKQSEQEVQPLIDKMRNKGKYSEEMIQLVKEDLMLGFKKTEIDQYANRKYDIRQMRIYSDCMRNDYSKEVIDVICGEELNADQMTVLLDMYKNGIVLDQIKTIMAESEGVPKRMHEAFEKLQKALQQKELQQKKMQQACTEVEEKADTEVISESTEKEQENVSDPQSETMTESQKEYVTQILSELKDAVDKIQLQESRYDELNQKLAVFEAGKDDEAVRQRLVDELAEKDRQLDAQQDELSKANSALARLRNEKEQTEMKLKKEKEELQDEVDALKRKLNNAKLDLKEAESRVGKSEQEREIDTEGEEEMQYKPKETVQPQTTVISQQPQISGVGIPVYYQVPVVNKRGQIVQQLQIERMERKSNSVDGILGKLGFKKKSRADIVKLVASGELVPAQLVQIKSAIERGLTEGQLVELINNNVAAEKMKEIIEIAVLENSMA